MGRINLRLIKIGRPKVHFGVAEGQGHIIQLRDNGASGQICFEWRVLQDKH